MFPEAVVQPMPMAGSCSVAPAGTDQLDLEAAEQLIQLSGGDGGAADAVSESRSADSVKCRTKDEKEKKEAAVESRRRSGTGRIPAVGNDCNGVGESDVKKGVDSCAGCSASATAADVVEEEEEKKVVVVESCRRRRTAAADRLHAEKKDRRDGGIVRGEARKRPRFRSLADIYRDTEPGRLTAGAGEGHADRDPPEGERTKEEKKKSAADEVIAVDAEASKARRLRYN